MFHGIEVGIVEVDRRGCTLPLKATYSHELFVHVLSCPTESVFALAGNLKLFVVKFAMSFILCSFTGCLGCLILVVCPRISLPRSIETSVPCVHELRYIPKY